MLRPLDLLSLGRECTWLNLLFLDRGHTLLDLAIDLNVKLAALSQLLEHLVLVSTLRCLESHVTLTLEKKKEVSDYLYEQIMGGNKKNAKAVSSFFLISVLIACDVKLTSSLYWGTSLGSS